MPVRFLLPAALVLACLLAPARLSAQEQPAPPDVLSALTLAQNAYSSGDNITALNAISDAQQALWNASPLGVRNVAFVTEQATDFGMYNPKIGEEFPGDEPMILYCEPFGYTQVRGEDGTYSFSLIASVNIVNAQGQVVGGKQNLGPFNMSGLRSFYTQFIVCFTLGIRGLEPGSYTVRVTLTDNFDTTKSVDVEKSFNWLSEPDA
ncbi:MAG: hypothetical protein LBP95_12300 [Deltaproteobacteria bacterium]|jgi:hypothetical protein|nr:hypothetical protein [Deltaproteobacteria bacterium]